MTLLNRYRVVWTGGPAGEGVSTFFGPNTDVTAYAVIRDFFDAIKGLFPTTFTWTFPASGDVLEDSTGTLTGGWTATPGAAISGTVAGASYAAGVGARVRWTTSSIVGGRRVSGATFLTSLSTTNFATDGTLIPTALSTLTSAATTAAGSGELRVYSRPSPGGSDGTSSTVTGATVPDRVTALRSRRY